jgi:hypothetical protein
MKKRLVTLLLLVSMLAATACGAGEASGSDTTASAGADNTTAAPAETQISDDLGAYDFGGDEFHMLTRVYPMFHAELNVAEHMDLAKQYNLKQAPTLAVIHGEETELYVGAAEIKAYLKGL